MSSQLLNKIRRNRLEKKKRPIPKENSKPVESNKSVKIVQNIEEQMLNSLAEQELLREAVSGSVRADVAGPTGWLKCPLNKTNKRFLRNTLTSTIKHNGRKNEQDISSSKPQSKDKIEVNNRQNNEVKNLTSSEVSVNSK
uniref:Putative dna-directed rna polymerases i and iii subunit rpac2 isoform 1 n=1 Tax=Xenopsylla cheopis TaxID=163159 RepID=A0A6M2DLT7_XENCH